MRKKRNFRKIVSGENVHLTKVVKLGAEALIIIPTIVGKENRLIQLFEIINANFNNV